MTNQVRIAFALSLLLTTFGAASKPDYDPVRPYALYSHGPSSSADYFPIAVWLQSPENAAQYRAAGFNLFIGLWQGPTEAQLAALKAAEMPVICEQNGVGLKHLSDPTIVGWMHQDEPDNAQPVKNAAGKEEYGPCVPPQHIVEEYHKLRAADPSRPVMLNLGQGVADDGWIGRGTGAKPEDYATYVLGGDIVSFDIYPVASNLHGDGAKNLNYVSQGVDRLRHWAGDGRTVWNCIECTRISGTTKATPDQVKAEVWMALIHGSRGLIYFVHQFSPSFNEHALLDDKEMLSVVTATNRQKHELGGVLNTPSSAIGTVSIKSSDPQIDTMVKIYRGHTYIFSVNTKGVACDAFTRITGVSGQVVEALGESRTVPISDGKLADKYQPYEVHIYRAANK